MTSTTLLGFRRDVFPFCLLHVPSGINLKTHCRCTVLSPGMLRRLHRFLFCVLNQIITDIFIDFVMASSLSIEIRSILIHISHTRRTSPISLIYFLCVFSRGGNGSRPIRVDSPTASPLSRLERSSTSCLVKKHEKRMAHMVKLQLKYGRDVLQRREVATQIRVVRRSALPLHAWPRYWYMV